MRPVIAVIGRPNVGKSTLFNRLAGRGKAIVIDEPGATRDRNYADGEWQGRPFVLIDTGGFEPAATDGILAQMREQTTLAMEEADIIVFLMDGRDGLTPADREIAAMLRKIEKPVFHVVNKIDGPKHEPLAYDFHALGVEAIFTLSAQHGQGVFELMDAMAHLLPEEAAPPPEEEERRRIAVIGKPNVGKSSLINRLLGYERTIANPTPGTTRDSIDTPFERQGRSYLLVDTAGIRRKSRVSLTLEKYSIVQALKAIDRCDIAVILIDAVEGITEQDVKIAGLAHERGTACILAVNKWDLVAKDNETIGVYVKDIKDKAKFLDFAPIVFISALSGQRVARLFDLAEKVYEQYTRRVSTGDLNRALRAFTGRNPPPRSGGRPNAFAYVTQAGVKPPTFIFFVRDPRAVHFSYERYLANQLREAFGFDSVPLRIFFKKKSKSPP
ncbi:MAG: ribosome biogenesis GTPase Der [Pseudomonadota bacterium]|nr:ribosome biogenesis GTPase Der [Pseudomonadota bacterium]